VSGDLFTCPLGGAPVGLPPPRARQAAAPRSAGGPPAPALACSGREQDRFRRAVVLASGIPKPLIQVPERLTQVTLIVVASQQALLRESFRDFARSLLVEAASPDCTLQDRQDPDQHLGVAVLPAVPRPGASYKCPGYGCP
jgi:hypothetical protein